MQRSGERTFRRPEWLVLGMGTGEEAGKAGDGWSCPDGRGQGLGGARLLPSLLNRHSGGLWEELYQSSGASWRKSRGSLPSLSIWCSVPLAARRVAVLLVVPGSAGNPGGAELVLHA